MLSFNATTLNIALAEASDDIAQYVDNLPNNTIIDDIAQEEQINTETLRYFVKCVLLGVLPFHFFVRELMDELEIIEEDAISTAKSVRKKVLAPFINELSAMQEDAEKRFLETQDDDYIKQPREQDQNKKPQDANNTERNKTARQE